MTEQHPENGAPEISDFDPAFVQYITLDNEDQAAVFTRDGKVFYNLDSLFTQFAQPIMVQGMIAELTGDQTQREYIAGAASIVESIRQSALGLKAAVAASEEASDLEKAFNLPDAEDPFGFTGEDGDLS